MTVPAAIPAAAADFRKLRRFDRMDDMIFLRGRVKWGVSMCSYRKRTTIVIMICLAVAVNNRDSDSGLQTSGFRLQFSDFSCEVLGVEFYPMYGEELMRRLPSNIRLPFPAFRGRSKGYSESK